MAHIPYTRMFMMSTLTVVDCLLLTAANVSSTRMPVLQLK